MPFGDVAGEQLPRLGVHAIVERPVRRAIINAILERVPTGAGRGQTLELDRVRIDRGVDPPDIVLRDDRLPPDALPDDILVNVSVEFRDGLDLGDRLVGVGGVEIGFDGAQKAAKGWELA